MRARLLFYAAIFAIAQADFNSAQRLQEESLKARARAPPSRRGARCIRESPPAIVEISIMRAQFSNSASRLGEIRAVQAHTPVRITGWDAGIPTLRQNSDVRDRNPSLSVQRTRVA